MDKERIIAIEYLEELQKKYCQFPSLNQKNEIQKLLTNDVFSQPIYKQFQEKHPTLTFEEFISTIKKQSFVDELIADGNYQNPNWANLLSSILVDLKPAIKERYGNYTGKYLFGSLAWGQVNGFAIKVPNSTYKLIVLSEGVFGFSHLITKAIQQIFYIPTQQGAKFIIEKNIILHNLESAPIVWDRVFDLIMAYAVDANPYQAKQYYLESKDLDFNIHYALRDAMEIFILGHEFGHILQGHLDDRFIHPDNDYKIILNQLQEFEADNIGLNLSLIVSTNKNIGTAVGFAGADFFFGSMSFFGKCLSLLKFGHISEENLNETHPPFGMRKNYIKGLLSNLDRSEVEEILDFAHTLEMVLETLFDKLQPALLNAFQKGIKPHVWWN